MQWLGDIETPKCSHLPSWYIFTASSSGLKYTFTVYSLSLVLSKHFQLLFVKGEIMFCDSHIIILITIMINIRLQISANRKHPYSCQAVFRLQYKELSQASTIHHLPTLEEIQSVSRIFTYFSRFWYFDISRCCPCHWNEILVHCAPEAMVASPANPSLVRTTNRKSLDWQRHKIPAPYDWKYWTHGIKLWYIKWNLLDEKSLERELVGLGNRFCMLSN